VRNPLIVNKTYEEELNKNLLRTDFSPEFVLNSTNETINLDKYTFLTELKQDFYLDIPPQRYLRSDLETSRLKRLASGLTSMLFGNLILNIILSSSLQMLWGTINTMQLIILVTLFNLKFPQNAIYTFNLIAIISKFNLIPVDQIMNMIFSFDKRG
jgi:hypothetical protein